MSCGDLVLVRESIEDLTSADPMLGEVDLRRPAASLCRCEWPRARCGRAVFVVPQVLGQHPAQMVLIDDQQPVQELAAQGTVDSLADRVRSGRLRRAGENPTPSAVNTASKEAPAHYVLRRPCRRAAGVGEGPVQR